MDDQILPKGSVVEIPQYKEGKVYTHEVTLDEDIAASKFQEIIDQQFPRTLKDVVDQMTVTSTPVSREEYELAKKEGLLGQGGVDKRPLYNRAYDILKEGVGAFLGGAVQTGKSALNREGNVLMQATASGTRDLLNLGQIGYSLGLEAILPESLYSDYDTYLVNTDIKRQAEELDKGIPLIGGQQLTPEEVAKIKSAANFVDVTTFIPAFKLATAGVKAGAKALGKSIGKEALEGAAETVGKETAGEAAESVGKMKPVGSADFASKEEFLDGLKKIADESAPWYRRAAAGAAGKVSEYALEGPYDALAKMSRFAKEHVGKKTTDIAATGAGVGIASSEEYRGDALGLGVLILGAKGLGKVTTTASKILGDKRAASSILAEMIEQVPAGKTRPELRILAQVPDPVYNVARNVLDASLEGTLLGTSLGYMRAEADPTSSTSDKILGGISGAAMGATVGAASAVPGSAWKEISGKSRKQNFTREFAKDILQRPESRKTTVMGEDLDIPNERDNRIKFFANENIPLKEKQLIHNILASSELAGTEVFFVDNTTKLTDRLAGSGDKMGAGAYVMNDSGTPVVIVNVDRINARTAIEEIAHSLIADKEASKAIDELVKNAGDPEKVIQDIADGIGKEYIDATRKVDPKRADGYQQDLNFALDPRNSMEDRRVAVMDMVHEYLARGVAERLAGKRPEAFLKGGQEPLISKVWNDVTNSIKSAIASPATGATFDPINKVFYKDGKLIQDPVLDSMTASVFGKVAGSTAQKAQAEKQAKKAKPAKDSPPAPGEKGAGGETVIDVITEPRYEARTIDPKTGQFRVSTPDEVSWRHDHIYQALRQIFPEVEANTALGVGAGRINDGTTLAFADKVTPEQLSALFQVNHADGTPLIKPENQKAVAAVFDSLNNSHITDIEGVVSLAKTLDSNTTWTVRSGVKILPMAIQQTSPVKKERVRNREEKGPIIIKGGSGPMLVAYDLDLLNDLINHQQEFTPAVKKALKEFKIKTLDDVIPVVQEYFANYSSDSAKPAAKALAEAFKVSDESATVMRDLLHLGGGLKPGKDLTYADVKGNVPGIDFMELPPSVRKAFTLKGEKTQGSEMRDRSVFKFIRLDEIYNAKPYAPTGEPVKIDLDRSRIFPRIKANFSPGTGVSIEDINGSRVVIDDNIGAKMYIDPDGKTKLFMVGEPMREFNDQWAARLASDNIAKKKGLKSTAGYTQGFTVGEIKGITSDVNYADLMNGVAAKEIQAVQRETRNELESPDVVPSWVYAKNQREADAAKVQTEMRKRGRSFKKLDKAGKKWIAKPTSETPVATPRTSKSSQRVEVSPEVLEYQAMAQEGVSVTPALGKKPDVVKTQAGPIKAFADIPTYVGTREPAVTAEYYKQTKEQVPKEVADFISTKKKTKPTDPKVEEPAIKKTELIEDDRKYIQKAIDVISSGKETVGFLQMKLHLSYSQASRILDYLKENGYTKSTESKPSPKPEETKKAEPKKAQPPKSEEPKTSKQDTRIPQGFTIKKSPSGKYRIIITSSATVKGIENDYEQAVKSAKRFAAQR